MTAKQEKFAHEYLIDLNATQAAIRAGYSIKTAMEQGYQLLQKTSVQEFIQDLQLKLQTKTGITQEKVLAEFAKIAFFDIRKAYTVNGGLKNIHEFDDDVAGAVVGIETYDVTVEDVVIGTTKKIKIADKKGALDSLAKHLGMFEKDNAQKKPELDFSKATITFK